MHTHAHSLSLSHAQFNHASQDIQQLWDELNVPDKERHAFSSSVHSLSEDTLHAGEKELARLRAQMGTYQDSKRLRELMKMAMLLPRDKEKLNKLMLDYEQGIASKHDLEDECANLSKQVEMSRKILTTIQEREKLVAFRLKHASTQRDPARLKTKNFRELRDEVCGTSRSHSRSRSRSPSHHVHNHAPTTLAIASSGCVTRSVAPHVRNHARNHARIDLIHPQEIMEKKVKNDLPTLNQVLEKRLTQWEKDHRMDFVVNGSRYLDVLREQEDTWRAHQTQALMQRKLARKKSSDFQLLRYARVGLGRVGLGEGEGEVRVSTAFTGYGTMIRDGGPASAVFLTWFAYFLPARDPRPLFFTT